MALSGIITGTTDNKYIDAKVEWSATQDKLNNYSTITATLYYSRNNTGYTTYGNWSGSITINGTTVSATNRITITYQSNTVAMSATVKVPHNTDGTKSCVISAAGGFSGLSMENTYLSGTVILDEIPRQANIITAPDFNDEENPTITYNNKAGNAATTLQACISLTGDTDDISYRDISKTGSSYTFNLTDAERKILRQATTANSRTVRFEIKTILNGSTFYSGMNKTFSITNGNPTLNPTVEDNNATTIALTGNNQRMIKYYSNASYTIGAQAIKEATLSSQKVECGGKSASTASGVLSNVESGDFVFTAIDSRGNITTQTVKKTIVNYIKLTCNCEPSTPNAAGEMTLKINGNYFNNSFGAQDNAITVRYRLKVNNDEYGDWITTTATLSGNTYSASVSITDLDYQSKYTFQAQAADLLMSINSAEKSVKTTPVFDWSKDDFRFNVPVSIMGNDLDDFVIDAGDDGTYAYRKWNSGILEAWLKTNKSVSVSTSQTYGNLYYADGLSETTSGNASQFVAVEDVQLTINKNGVGGFWLPVVANWSISNGAVSISYLLVNPISASTTIVPCVRIIGRWK